MIIGYDLPRYLPNIKYFWRLAQCDAWVFMDEGNVKEDFHRTDIKTPNGRMVLTVPIQRTSNPIKDARILTGNWQAQHWDCIEKAYTGCKYHNLKEIFQGFLLKKRWENLSDLNIKGIKFLCKILQIKTKLYRESVHGRDFPDAIPVDKHNFSEKTYPQMHGKFVPNLSVIDYLFNTGSIGKYNVYEYFSGE